MLVYWLFLEAAFHASLAQYEAGCTMKLHNTDVEIGKVVFKSEDGFQRISAHLEGDPGIITEGWHGFHVHEKPVMGNDCGAASTGGHFNPDGSTHGDRISMLGERHVGDFGNVRAGERGEINFDMKITIDPTGFPMASMLGEPAMRCAPIKVKVYMDGREEPYDGPDEERMKRSELRKLKKNRNKNKGGKKKKGFKKCTRKRERKGKCTKEEKFFIMEKMPDCYVPKSTSYKMTMLTPKFELQGQQSIVGRAVVLHAGEDDLGRGGDEGSLKTGNAGSRIACCTLTLTEGQ